MEKPDNLIIFLGGLPNLTIPRKHATESIRIARMKDKIRSSCEKFYVYRGKLHLHLLVLQRIVKYGFMQRNCRYANATNVCVKNHQRVDGEQDIST